MSDPVTNAEVEDVLSSIRRLVSEDNRPKNKAAEPATSDRLVLTPALRVAESAEAVKAEASEIQQANGDALNDAPNADAQGAEDGQAFVLHEHHQADANHAPIDEEALRIANEVAEEEFDWSAHLPAQDDSADEQVQEQAQEHSPEQQQDSDQDEYHDAQEAQNEEAQQNDALTESVAALLNAEPATDKPHDEDANADASADLNEDEAEALLASLSAAPDPEVEASAPIAFDTQEDGEADEGGEAHHAHSQGDDHAGEEGAHFDSNDHDDTLAGENSADDTAADENQADEETQSFSAKIAALETVIARTEDQWDPDDTGDSDYSGTEAPAMAWSDIHAEDEADHSSQSDEAEMFDGNEDMLDEDALRDLVSDIVRQELQGALGERITRNVRKLVRREIHRALAAQELE